MCATKKLPRAFVDATETFPQTSAAEKTVPYLFAVYLDQLKDVVFR